MSREKRSLKLGITTGLAVVAYCGLVSVFMMNGENIFSNDGMIAGIVILLIFVISAAITGGLVFGYPAYLFVRQEFRRGLYAIIANILTIVVVGALMVCAVMLINYYL